MAAIVETPTTISRKTPSVGELEAIYTKFVKLTTPHVSDENLAKNFKTIISDDGGAAWLYGVLSPPALTAPDGLGNAFKNSVSANCQIGSVTFFLTARLSLGSPINGAGSVKFGGFFSPGVELVWGGFWYDDVDQIKNSELAMVSAQGLSVQVTLYKNSLPIGAFVGGGIGTVNGIGGGAWDWS